MKRKISVLFKELCCSQCKSDFGEESVRIMREENDMLVVKITCQECGKAFGVSFLGISDFEFKPGVFSEDDMALQVQDGMEPITTDEVLDAHKFIKDIDKNWRKFMDKLDS